MTSRFAYAFSILVLIGIMFIACGDDTTTNNYGDTTTREIDSDGDGLSDDDEVQVYKTSPVLWDTDGDGMSDFTECIDYGYDPANNRYRYNPLIADLPKLSIRLTSPPSIALHLTDTQGESRTFETGRSDESAETVGESNTDAVATSIEAAVQSKIGLQPEVGSSFSFGVETSHSYTVEQTWENRQTVSNSEAFERSNEIAASGGSIMVTGQVENQGDIAFTIKNLILTAVVPDFRNSVVFNPVGNLVLDTSGDYKAFPDISIGPGETLDILNFINSHLDLELAKTLLWDSSSLVLKPSSIEITDADGTPFAFNREEVQAKTATINIDYGEHRQAERYRVATNADPDNRGLTIGEIMTNILDIPHETGSTSWGGVTKQGLTRVRDVANDETNNAYWVVVHTWNNGLETETASYDLATAGYDFGSIAVKAGHELDMVYIEDRDNDGIYSRQEFLMGSSDTMLDSDGDGLPDDQELAANPYVTDPGKPDTDGDGLGDFDDPEPLEKNLFEIAAGRHHNLILKTDGTLWAWGHNQAGQLGIGNDTSPMAEPVQVGTDDDWVKVSAGSYHTLAIKQDGTLWAWGDNEVWQLGYGSTEQCLESADPPNYVPCQTLPMPVGGDFDWVRIDGGSVSSAAIKANGQLWMWGFNLLGQLGDGSTTTRESPVLIGNDSDKWYRVSAGNNHTLANKSDGSLWAWGDNTDGALGYDYPVSKLLPAQVGGEEGATNWEKISASKLTPFSLAVKTNGTLYAWGYGSSGQLGSNSTRATTPKGVGTGWRDISAGSRHTLAIRTNGTLWAWGSNTHGQLGLGDYDNRNVPVQVGTANTWVGVSAGHQHSMAVAGDSFIYTWGANDDGQLGNGTVGDDVTEPQCIMSIIPGKVCP